MSTKSQALTCSEIVSCDNKNDDVPPRIISNKMSPLDIDEVSRHICTYLSYQNLQNVRLLSTTWRRIATRHLLSRSVVSVTCKFYNIPGRTLMTSEEREDHLQVLENFVKYTTALSIPLPTIRITHIETIDLFTQYDVFNGLVTTLKFLPHTHPPTPSQPEEQLMSSLYKLLLLLPSLENLETYVLTPSVLLEEERDSFLQKMSILKRISAPSDRILLQDGVHQKLNAMTTIQVYQGQELETFMRFYIKQKVNWRIQKVMFHIDPSVPTDLLRSFFTGVRENLKNLVLYFNENDSNIFEMAPTTWQDNWLLPLTLESLQKLTIWEHYDDEDIPDNPNLSFMLRTMGAAMFLPQLKELVLRPGQLESLSKMVDTWDDLGHRKNWSGEGFPMLEKLVVDGVYNLIDLSYFRLNCEGNLWRKVKTLDLHWVTVQQGKLLDWVFSEMGHLTSLTLKLMCQNKPNWTYWLTGIDNNDEGHPELTHERTNLFLKDLKELNYLKVVFGDGHEKGSVSDFLIENSILHLTKLKNLIILNEQFSPATLQIFKKSLDPDAFIGICENPSIFEIINFA